jgi:hypothetical protein
MTIEALLRKNKELLRVQEELLREYFAVPSDQRALSDQMLALINHQCVIANHQRVLANHLLALPNRLRGIDGEIGESEAKLGVTSNVRNIKGWRIGTAGRESLKLYSLFLRKGSTATIEPALIVCQKKAMIGHLLQQDRSLTADNQSKTEG